MEAENQKPIVSRLRRIEGQIRGLEHMVEDGRYCIDILTQLASTSAALQRVRDMIMKQHIENCVADTLENVNLTEKRKKIDEVIGVLNRFKK